MSKIEWTGQTWNPVIGCTECSPGCMNCYAAKMAYRLMHIPSQTETYAGIAKKLPNGRIVFSGKIKELPDRLLQPYQIKKPTTFFVNSMSDLFHPDVTFNFLFDVFKMMYHCPQHTFQILTKQGKQMEKMLDDVYLHLWRNFPELNQKPLHNVWLGISAENQKYLEQRIWHLLRVPAAIRFISYEPALEGINLEHVRAVDDPEEPDCKYYKNVLSPGGCYDAVYESGETDAVDGPYLPGIDWVICGGESGNGKNIRPMHPDWALSVRDQCLNNEVAFFFKQWGNWQPFYDRDKDDPDWRKVPAEIPNKVRFMTINATWGFHGNRIVFFQNVGKHAAGNSLDGQTYLQMPKIKES